ncbi:MAG: hypothetical protein J6V72_04295 [Kiritimatiellae bacterium]|nr:hypothetical protein [Kiritimatiellia bacterium]
MAELKHAVYSGTRNLYEPMMWSAKSLYANSSIDRIHFLIEDDEFPFEMPSFCDFMNVKEYAEQTFPDTGPNANSHFTKMAMVRICYPNLLHDIGKVLQLDADTVVVDNVDELWDIPMDGKWFAACHESLSGYDPFRSGHYHNVGVCMFNLDQMRKDKAQAQLVNFINTRRANCIEQDALNACGAMKGKSVDMPVRFNENRACGYTDEPAIVHFVGYMDWQTNPNLPRREYLKLYRDKSWDEIMELHEQHRKNAK